MTSWWVFAQQDRETFRKALEQELSRMTADAKANAMVDNLKTAQWAQGFAPKPRIAGNPGTDWSAR